VRSLLGEAYGSVEVRIHPHAMGAARGVSNHRGTHAGAAKARTRARASEHARSRLWHARRGARCMAPTLVGEASVHGTLVGWCGWEFVEVRFHPHAMGVRGVVTPTPWARGVSITTHAGAARARTRARTQQSTHTAEHEREQSMHEAEHAREQGGVHPREGRLDGAPDLWRKVISWTSCPSAATPRAGRAAGRRGESSATRIQQSPEHCTHNLGRVS
jgi:hypothetical protein